MAQITESGSFCVNIATGDLRDQVNASSAGLPAGDSEFRSAGIEAAECDTIDCPRVAHAAAALECRMTRILPLAGKANFAVLGVVTGIHIRDDCLLDGRFDPRRAGGWPSAADPCRWRNCGRRASTRAFWLPTCVRGAFRLASAAEKHRLRP